MRTIRSLGRRRNAPSARGGRPQVAPTDHYHNRQSFSEARHRRRPGGPGRYRAAAFRACRVIPMRAARGAAAPASKPKKEPGVDARPVLALSVQLSAAMNPRIGGSRVGEAPRPFFPPISSGRNGGARRAGTRREAGPPLNGRPQVAPTDGAPGRRAPRASGYGDKRADTIRPYGLGSWRTALGRPAPRGHARFRAKKRAARDTGGACVYRSSRKYAKPRLAGGCLSRLLRREVKISTTTVTT